MMKRLYFLFFALCVLFAACVQKENYPSPLEGVHIDNQSFTSESSKIIIDVNSSLANVQAEVIDTETDEPADWLKVDVARQKLTLTITENLSVNERTAQVTLYTIDRNDVDNNSLTVVFYVTQSKNTQFDGLKIEEVVVDHRRCDTVVVFDHVVTNVKATVVDLDGNKADWVKTTMGTNYLTLTIAEHVSKGERQALIRLLPNSKTKVADSLLPSTNFLITQKHNPVLDSLTIEPQKLSSESASHVVHTNRLLTNIRALAIDDATTQKASWLTVLVAGDSITLNTTVHSQQADRSATVTLYLPNNGDAIDSTTISLPFTVSQSHNNIFDGANYHHRYIEWNQAGDTLKLTRELKDVKCQLTDTLTHKNPSWLSASVEGKNVVFKPSKLTAKTDRTVQVTLYMGTLNEEAVQTSFYVTQRHNNIFDGEPFRDRTVEWNQLKDTLKLTRELTDIKCDLIDNETKKAPRWLTAAIEGKTVVFTMQANTSIAARSATVTLYLPNGYGYDENDGTTIKTTFQIEQGYEVNVIPDQKKIEVNYEKQDTIIHVTSNTKYQTQTPGNWVSCVIVSQTETTEELHLSFTENTGNQANEGDLIITNAGTEVARIALKQRTNPKIQVNFADGRQIISVTRGAAEIELPVKTLTPVYTIKKQGNWLSVGEQKKQNDFDQYYHKVKISQFTGNAFERTDTLRLYNDEYTLCFPVKQHKYIYMDTTAIELEVGQTYQLGYQKSPNISNSVTWRSEAEKFASVSQNGLVTALAVEKGKAKAVRIFASLGKLENVDDYNDYTTVTVFDVPDKLDIARGVGSYEKQDSLVTSACPIVITNRYYKDITLDSVGIVNHYDSVVAKPQVTLPVTLSKNQQRTFSITPSLSQVKNPRIRVVFTCNGRKFTKYVNY